MKINEPSKTLITESTIQQRLRELGQQIASDYQGRELHLVGVLKGGFVFMADLMRQIDVPCFVHFLHASSYRDQTVSTGKVEIEHKLDLKDCHVLIVEDILDTGRTLTRIIEDLSCQNPASIKICTLLDKPSRRIIPVQVHYIGFTIPDHFVVGYGLDVDERYRDMREIAYFPQNEALH